MLAYNILEVTTMAEIIAIMGDSVQQFMWLVAVLFFGILEASTVSLVSIWFMGGALIAMVLSMLGLPLWIQITMFITTSALLLIFTKPLVEKWLNTGKVKTNADALIGKQARVTETIDNNKSTGAVYVDGKTWTARNTIDDIVIDIDKYVEVVRIEGVKLIVDYK